MNESKNDFLGAVDYAQLSSMDIKSDDEKRLESEEDKKKKDFSVASEIQKQAELEPVISDQNVIKACIGSTNNQSNANFATFLYRYTGDMQKFVNGEDLLESDYTEEAKRTYKNPILDVKLNGEFVQFDFCFKSGTDPELRILWTQLEMYGDLLNYYYLDQIKAYPFLSINIMPKKYLGRCYLSICNPYYWTLEPEHPGMSINNVIRLIAKAENLIVNSDVLDEVNIQQMDAEIKRSFM